MHYYHTSTTKSHLRHSQNVHKIILFILEALNSYHAGNVNTTLNNTILLPLHHAPQPTLPPPLTSVYTGEPPPEVDKSRQLLDAILLGVARVPDLDEGDIEVVCLVVNLLQLHQDFITLGGIII